MNACHAPGAAATVAGQGGQGEGRAPTTEAPPQQEFLTVPQATAIFGLKRSRLYDLIKKGEVPCVRQGRSVRISRRALDALHERAGAPPVAPVAPGTGAGLLPTDPAALSALVEQAAARGVQRALHAALSALGSAA